MNDPFPVAKRHVQEQVNKLQQEYSRWTTMMLSNPGRLGLGDRISMSCKALTRTLTTMDKSVDKAEMDPERFHIQPNELADRRQWIQDTRAHVKQIQSSLDNMDHSFTAVAIPGNAELHSDVSSAHQEQQFVLAQQDEALERIEEAAARVGRLGMAIGTELREQEGLLDAVDRDTEGVMSRVSASMYKLQDVLKKMNFCTQIGIIIVLFVVLIGLLWYTFG